MLIFAQNDMETGACPRRSLTLDELRWLEASAWFEGRASRPASPAVRLCPLSYRRATLTIPQPSDRDSFPPRWSTLSTSAPERSSAFPSHYDLPLKPKSPMHLRCVLVSAQLPRALECVAHMPIHIGAADTAHALADTTPATLLLSCGIDPPCGVQTAP